MIQKHAASHLHYGFRLEMHDVLKSWAVPKGVPFDLNQRRLAMATEDHPLEYLEFEGNIPKGQYGGGTVMVWDIGTYELIEGNYYKGRLRFSLHGKKLNGEWELVRDAAKEKNKRLLVKAGENAKPVTAKRENASALTGRTMEQTAGAKDATWHSNRTNIPDLNLDELPEADMVFMEPMQAKPYSELPNSARSAGPPIFQHFAKSSNWPSADRLLCVRRSGVPRTQLAWASTFEEARDPPACNLRDR